jgi:hypothetical protein
MLGTPMKILILLLIPFFCFTSYAEKIPRQRIEIKGYVKAVKSYKMNELSSLPQVKMKIVDPYSHNKKIMFQGVYLSDIFKEHASEGASKLEIIAINDYKVLIPIEVATKEKMILAYKGNELYLTVSNRGPARIVIPYKGKLSEGQLTQKGINWVWFVKTINILK